MRTTYGQKRDYRKIDLYLSGEYICTKYICSTTWARTLTEAREALRLERQGLEGKITARFNTREAT